MAVVLANNATSLLAGSITSGDATISIATGDAANFPSPSDGDWTPVTVVDNAGHSEIMRMTGRNGAILTVARGQEGTTPYSFAAGARVEVRVTKAVLDDKASLAGVTAAEAAGDAARLALCNDLAAVAVAGGTANAITVVTAKGEAAYATGTLIGFTAMTDNTGDTQINANTLGPRRVFLNGSGLVGGEILAGLPYSARYDATLDSGAGGWHLWHGRLRQIAVIAGTIDGVTIGGAAPAAGAFTTLSATGPINSIGAGALRGLFRNTNAAEDVFAQFFAAGRTAAPSFEIGQRSAGNGYVAVNGYQWTFQTDGNLKTQAGAYFYNDGNVRLTTSGLNTDLVTIINRHSRIRLGSTAAFSRPAGGMAGDLQLSNGCVLTGLGGGHDGRTHAAYYRQILQTDIWGNWYAISSD